MSSTVKAGLISVFLIVVLVAAGYFLFIDGKAPVVRLGPTAGDGEAETVPALVTPKPEVDPSASLAPLPQRGSIELSVKIVESDTGRPLSRARLQVYRSGEGTGMGKLVAALPESNAARSAVLACRLGPGRYTLLAFASGYSRKYDEVSLIEGQGPIARTIALDRGTSISGRVLTQDGSPIVGAEVAAFERFARPGASLEDTLIRLVDLEKMQEEPPQTATSGPDGYYQIDGLALHIWYDVRATSSGFSPGEAEKIEAPRENVDIRMIEGGVLEGFVRDRAQNPIEGAVVEVYDTPPERGNLFDTILAYSRTPIETVRSDATGHYQLTQIGGGKYNFRVTAKGFQPFEESDYRVIPGAGESKNFRLQAGYVLRGIVRGPDDQPVAGARVKVSESGASAARRPMIRVTFQDDSVLTDESGMFVLDTLEDAPYLLLASHENYQTAQRRDVRPSTEELVINLALGSQLEGIVASKDTGDPIPGALVSIADTASLRKEATTDQEGRYFISGLNATRGKTTAYVSAPGYARTSGQVNLRANQKAQRNFELEQTGKVSGRVLLASGDGLGSAHVEVRRYQEETGTNQVIGTGETDSDGHYEIPDVEPGEGLRLRVRRDTYLDTYSEPFDVAPGEQAAVPDVVLSLGGSIGGVVRASDGRPIEGCMVSLLDAGETDIINQGKSTHSIADGSYLVQGLAQGRYRLEFSAQGFASTVLEGVEVREGQVNIDQNVVLEEAGRVAGRVLDPDGQPIALAQVKVQDFADGVKEHATVTDASGRFEVASIVSKDEVGIIISHDEYSTHEEPSVPVGTTDLSIILRPLGRFFGTVVDSNGVPLPNFTVQPVPQGNSISEQRAKAKLRAKTFSGGRFDYGGIPEGVYDLSIGAPQFATVVIGGQTVRGAEEIDLGEIVLESGGRILGHVVEAATGRPISGANVRILQGLGRFTDRTAGNPLQTTREDGSFEFTGLKDGNLTLEVTHAAFGTVRQAGVNPQVASTSLDIEVRMERGGTISGSVLDTTGSPIDGMWVYLGSDRKTPTDGRGNFTFANVTPGAHIVKAHKFVPNRLPIMTEREVEVGPGGHVEVRLEVEAP